MGHKMDKQEYAKCIEDDIDFLKRNLPESLFKCLWTSHIIEVLKASVNMIYDQTSLPSGLDEAVDAQMEADGDVDHFVRKGIDEIALKYAKLGAEWMAGQYEKIEGELVDWYSTSDGKDYCYGVKTIDSFEAPEGFYIRKK